MAYRVNFLSYDGVFALPNCVVDEHLKLCGAVSLKALLFLLRTGKPEISAEEIAGVLSVSVGDAKDALSYWVDKGVLINSESPSAKSYQTKATAKTAQKNETAIFSPPPASESTPVRQLSDNLYLASARPPKLSSIEISAMRKSRPEIQILLDEVQHTLGTQLTPSMMSEIVSIYEWAGLSVAYVMLIVEYCVSIEKRSVRYITSTMISWINSELDTYEKAEQHLQKLRSIEKRCEQFRKAFGYDIKLSLKEQQKVHDWYEIYCFDDSLIKAAIELTVETIGKSKIAYSDRILLDWHSQGHKTADEIKKSQQKNDKNTQLSITPSYDISEMEKMYSI